MAFCATLFLAAVSAFAADDRHVVIITMDGFPNYVFRDPHAPIPTLRSLAAQGVAAEGMRPSNPSITWPNHTTLVTGVTPAKHSVLFNGLLIREGAGKPDRIDMARDQAELIAVPTLWDIAHAASLSTAAINWPCSRNSPSLNDCIPDVPNPFDHTSPDLRKELIEAGIMPASKTALGFLSPPQQDQMWTAAACYVIRRRQPNLLVLHLLLTDTVHHQYGPQSTAAFTAMAVADYELHDVLNALADAGIHDKTTVFVTTDHGFARFTKLIQPNVLLQREGISPGQVQIITEGGCAFVYFNDPATAPRFNERIVSLFSGREGIGEVIRPDRFASLGLPMPGKNSRMGNLLLTAKDGYSFGPGNFGEYVMSTSKAYTVGGHGYMSDNPRMTGMFVAAGRGIKKGAKLGMFDNTSVAPTAAYLLGPAMACADGRILTEILSEPPAK
jgi:predicted AlkP superfamily pyrophosphatase or phosphodiesterase